MSALVKVFRCGPYLDSGGRLFVGPRWKTFTKADLGYDLKNCNAKLKCGHSVFHQHC